MPSPQRTELQHWYRQAEHALSARDYERAHRFCMSILSAAPGYAGALFLLGRIAVEHSNFSTAAEVLEHAIQLDAHDPRFHAQLARCLVALHRPSEAIAAAHQALALEPEDALTLDTIGVVLTHTGAHEQAVRPFQLAVAREPARASFHYNLGTSLQFSGRFDEAEQALRRALELDGNLWRAWSALAQVLRGPLAPEDAQRLQQALERVSDPDAELQLCHALAKHYEEQQLYTKTWQLLTRGKRAKRQTLQYSSSADAELFAAARQSWNSAAGSTGHDSAEPIFIVGMPRTGATLLERILASHPQIFAAGELTHFGMAVKRNAGTASSRALDPATLIAGPSLDLAKIGAEYVASTRPRTGHTQRFIDKMPLNFFFAGIIRGALPEARIICLRRHPLDTCLANYRQMLASTYPYHYTHDLLDIGRYYLQFDALVRHWQATLGDHYREVWYEDIVSDVTGTTRRLLEFCGLPWDPDCLDFQQPMDVEATAAAGQVRQPIHSGSIGRWRHYRLELAPLRELLVAHGITFDETGHE